MDRQPHLEGDLVALRPLQPDDWDALFAIASQREIWAMHPAHNRWQEPVFRAFFADALAQGGALAVIARASGALIGSSRFQGYDPAAGGSLEIGWTFLGQAYWGRGYNREMKRLMLAHAFTSVERVDFHVGEGNWRSRRALANIGAWLDESRTEDVDVPGIGTVRHLFYVIDRAGFAGGPLAA
ncbi:GNAT family N-acetyltransferase [Erythrobacter sp. EC-HK427]|uniref:GNAT family N-acetyltransferase n=1 Tax=Erythrobacter sp. EC-HK427 TaxID=2038396 RepID=UPI00125B3723|nr:GNAT family N-acetyltransferase [Erythrobacter sp. EC-HK427]VVT06888.1 GNAT family N-acetyltransferase [Erythrobacter sp. EC-HK427]